MDRNKSNRYAVSAFFLLAIITANRLFGLIRTFLLASIFGVSHEAAALELAQNLTSTLYDSTFGALIGAMFLPAYIARRQGLRHEQADGFAASLSLCLTLGVILLFIPFILFSEKAVAFLASDLSSQAQRSVAACLPPLSLAKVLLAVATLFTGILQADKKPLLPALVYALASLVGIPTVYAFRHVLTAATLSYLLLIIDCGILVFLFLLVQKRHQPCALSSILPKQVFQAIKRAVSVFLFSAYLPLVVSLSSLFFATIGKDSAVAVGGYALKPILLLTALLFSAFHGVYYPRLAEKRHALAVHTKKPLMLFITLSLLATAFFFILAKPILLLFLQNAAVSAEDMTAAVRIMRLYAVALPFLTLASIGNDLLYLGNKSGKTAFSSILSVLCYVLVFYLLKERIGIYAVPLSFLLSSAFRALLIGYVLKQSPQADGKIKLLFVLSDCNIGGAGRQMLNYLAHCNRTNFDVTVVLPMNSLLSERVHALGFPLVFCGKEASFSFVSLFSYYRLIQKYHPHILHANASLSARIAAFLAGVPIRIYTRHCVYPTPSFYKRRLPRLAMRCATSLLSTSVIAVAEEAANNLYSMGVPRKKVNVIVNGVDPISKKTDQREKVRQQHKILPDETLAVICGRIEPDKGIRILIEAAALLAKEEQPIKVLIVGKGSEENRLQTLTHQLDLTDRVHFCGFVNDVTPYLNAADVYVNCSVGTEATSLAIAEAMSLSLPIVATSYGGNTAMVKDGKNGILVPQNNPRALADALSIMTDSKFRECFGKTSYEIYASSFSAQTMAQANEALYQNLFIKKGYSPP